MTILLIETSTERGLIACISPQKVLFAQDLPFGSAQSKFLMPALGAALESLDLSPKELTCIGVGVGPGSYTGIRMGVAVAQALAYSWDRPLVGVPSLNGFIPSQTEVFFAAIIDARIGGAYVRKGYRSNTDICYLSDPLLCSLDHIEGILTHEVTHLITPSSQALKTKLEALYPLNHWIWEEKAPAVEALSSSIQLAYQQGAWKKPGQPLELLYLRETEAERERKHRLGQD